MLNPECIGKKVLISGATPVDPKNEVAPFAINACEITQDEFLAYEAQRSQSRYELVQKSCEAGAEWKVVDTRDSLEDLNSSPANVGADGEKICGIEIKRQISASAEDRPVIGGKFLGPKKPMINRNWQEARDFCLAQGGDLPTGKQWEKAARGPQGKTYAIQGDGKELNPELANYRNDKSPHAPADVGSYPPNDNGLYDMTGNVWEWVLDKCGSGTGCLRGGSWNYVNGWYLRADNDGLNVNPGNRFNDVGLRCVFPVLSGVEGAPQDSSK